MSDLKKYDWMWTLNPEERIVPPGFMSDSEVLNFRGPVALGSWSESMERFMENARRKSEKGALFDEKDVRRLWAGSFINNSLWECEEAEKILRKEIEIGMQMGGVNFIETVGNNWSFVGPRYSWIELSNRLTSSSNSPLLGFKKDDTVVVANLVGGMPYVPLVIESLKMLDRNPVGYALAGYSKHGDTRYEDGESMRKEVCIPPADLDVLLRNTDKTALIVDDSFTWGDSYSAMRGRLRRAGFGKKKIFEFVGSDAAVFGW